MKIPLIDTHRHFGGSISKECVWEIIQENNLSHIAASLNDVKNAMVIDESIEKLSFHNFLHKFKILDCISWDEDSIDKSVKHVCNDLEKEGIDFCWLDFSINKYMNLPWHKSEAIKFIYNRFENYRPKQVGLILSLKYESLRHTQTKYAELIDNPEISDILMGIDLVGDEEYFSSEFYSPIFKNWKSAGKMVRAHVGESQSSDNITSAITEMGVTNIAHGIKCVEDFNIMQLAKDNDITFDVALTSNYLTGVCSRQEPHPVLHMLNNGLKVTIGSDDPVQCNTSLSNELIKFKGMIQECDDSEELYRFTQETAFDNSKRFMN